MKKLLSFFIFAFALSAVFCLFLSAATVNSEYTDENGIVWKVTANDTDMTVFVKVADDDTTSPRFTLGSKTGTVKVY